MAIQDQQYGAYGVRRLTPEEQARVAAQQAQYQEQAVARQAQRTQQFEQVLEAGLANQAGRVGAPSLAAASQAPMPTAPVSVPAQQPVAQTQPSLANAATTDARVADITAQSQAPASTALNVAALQAGVDQTLAANRAPAPIPGERGNYNLANTSNVDAQGNITSRLRQPENIIEGGYGQFGGGRAAEFLSQRAGGGEATNRRDPVEEARLRNQLVSDNPFERRAAREQLAYRQALAVDAGATQRQALQVEGEQVRAGITGLAALQAAQTRAAGAQQAAQVQGEYGLQAAQTRAAGQQAAAETAAGSGSSLLSQVRAEQLARQLALSQAYQEAGMQQESERALGVPQRPAPRLTMDLAGNVIALDGSPVTPEQAAQYRQASGYYAVPQQ